MLEIFPGFCPVRFHVVCPDAGGSSYYLADEWIIDGVLREGFRKFDDCFTKPRSSPFKVVPLFVIGILSFIWHLAFAVGRDDGGGTVFLLPTGD